MRIVSQRRDASVEFDKAIIKIEHETIIRAVSYNDMSKLVLLGVYDTPERAREVFEDMHKAYAPVYSISDKLTEEEVVAMIMPSRNVSAVNIVNAGSEMCLTTYDNYVYYMPEE